MTSCGQQSRMADGEPTPGCNIFPSGASPGSADCSHAPGPQAAHKQVTGVGRKARSEQAHVTTPPCKQVLHFHPSLQRLESCKRAEPGQQNGAAPGSPTLRHRVRYVCCSQLSNQGFCLVYPLSFTPCCLSPSFSRPFPLSNGLTSVWISTHPLVAPQLTICPCCLPPPPPHERTGGTCVGKVQNTLSIPPVAHRMCSSTQEVRARQLLQKAEYRI